jgi:hypothetical protein
MDHHGNIFYENCAYCDRRIPYPRTVCGYCQDRNAPDRMIGGVPSADVDVGGGAGVDGDEDDNVDVGENGGVGGDENGGADESGDGDSNDGAGVGVGDDVGVDGGADVGIGV